MASSAGSGAGAGADARPPYRFSDAFRDKHGVKTPEAFLAYMEDIIGGAAMSSTTVVCYVNVEDRFTKSSLRNEYGTALQEALKDLGLTELEADVVDANTNLPRKHFCFAKYGTLPHRCSDQTCGSCYATYISSTFEMCKYILIHF